MCEYERPRAPVLSGIYWVQLLVGASGLVTQWVVGANGLVTEWVVGASGLVTQLQGNFSWGFQVSPGKFPFPYWAYVDWLAPGGLINYVTPGNQAYP